MSVHSSISPPKDAFFMEGACDDPGYRNTRDHPRGIGHKNFVESLWARYHHLADPHFREDARTHFLQRFWEMYLGVALLEHGFDLRRHGDEGPEFYAVIGDKRVWFEAVAPGPGVGPDKVLEPVPGEACKVPTEKILLRFTNALDEKRRKHAKALTKGIISAEDHYVLAINSKGIPHAWYGNSIPYFLQAFLPFGPLVVAIDTETGEIKDSFYQHRPEVRKLTGSPVSTQAFLGPEASFCPAVLHSGVDCGNHPDRLGADFSILHNPNAGSLPAVLFDWCEQFTLKGDELHRSCPREC